ncbi:MAG: response regulator transcription factor [Bacilli bacterium]|nr:response regulator transcription factor [Bacilli bacterium]
MYQNILLVEDDKGIVKMVSIALESNKYSVVKTKSGMEAINSIQNGSFDLVLLDLGLPDIDGVEVLKKIREYSDVPIIIISARFKEEEKVEALELGADDFLTKPFGVNELLARIKVVMRRYNINLIESEIVCFGELLIDFDRRIVQINDAESHLTPIEFNIIKYLVSNHGKVCTHKMIHEKVWGYDSNDDYQSLRVFMGNIRRKIKDDVANPKYIVTESGVGYRFIADIV